MLMHQGQSTDAAVRRELDRTRHFLDVMIEHLPIAIAIKEPLTRRFARVNRAYEKLFGRSHVELIGKTAREVFSEQHADAVDNFELHVVRSPDHTSNAELIIETADNGLCQMWATGLLVRDERGLAEHLVVAVEDVTEKKQSETRAVARRTLEHDLYNALENNELEVLYQPIVSLDNSEISGCEALLRWHHPTRGLISPAEFIPLAEEIGIISTIGEHVLRTACADAMAWPANIKVAVNVSPLQFRNPGLSLSIVRALGESGLAARRLEIEITEAVLLENDEMTLSILHQMRNLGISVALDDFGTGYSSLSYLRSFPFDRIKIDRSFVKDLAENNGSGAIVRAIVDLARNLGMATTVEGVETAAQMTCTWMLGCDDMQGYLFSPAVSADQILRLLSEDRWPGIQSV